MTADEWQQIFDDQLSSNWPKYDWGFVRQLDGTETSEKLNNAYATLRWYPASMVEVAITKYVQEHLDEAWPRTLWAAVKQYCQSRTQVVGDTYDEYGLTSHERDNIIRHNRDMNPAAWKAYTDEQIYERWLEATGYRRTKPHHGEAAT